MLCFNKKNLFVVYVFFSGIFRLSPPPPRIKRGDKNSRNAAASFSPFFRPRECPRGDKRPKRRRRRRRKPLLYPVATMETTRISPLYMQWKHVALALALYTV